jgi:hypothetical protein
MDIRLWRFVVVKKLRMVRIDWFLQVPGSSELDGEI